MALGFYHMDAICARVYVIQAFILLLGVTCFVPLWFIYSFIMSYPTI